MPDGLPQLVTQSGATALVLRELHQGVAPSWWPPAPGWWIVAALLLLAIVAGGYWVLRRRRRRAIVRLFNQTLAVAAANHPTAEVAAISELLRRAARQRDPGADRLRGEDWLHFLDTGLPRPVFADGPGRLLVDGPFRPEVAEADLNQLREVARTRFLAWMGASR